jgi:hypothetical protein
MIKCWNVFALRHLEKNQNEQAKAYLDLIDKYSIEDYSSYITTKTNLSCFYNNTNHFRNSKKIMSEIRRINIVKKLNDTYSETVNDMNFEKKVENTEPVKKFDESIIQYEIDLNYSDIALDYNNICSIQNKLKKYINVMVVIMIVLLKECILLHLTNIQIC